MKKILTAVLSSAFIMLLAATSSTTLYAQSIDWKVTVSQPAKVITSSSFNLDYAIMTVHGGQTFDVYLLNNGTPVSGYVQTVVTTAEKLGATGRFSLSGVPEGTYSYSVLAKNITEENEQLSDAAPFSVNLPDTQTIVVSSNGSSTTQSSDTDVTIARTNTTANGSDVTAVATTADGITDTLSTDTITDVAGTSNNARNFTIAGIALFALVIGTAWYGVTKFLDNRET